MIQNEQDALKKMRNIMEKEWGSITSQYANNIRVGKVINFNYVSRLANVRMLGTGEVLQNVRFQKGVTFNIVEQDLVVIISPDPKLKTQNFVVGIY